MPYATQQHMVDRYGEHEIIELTDRDDTGSINVTVLSQALTDAGDEIDAYVGVRYPLPLSPVPAVLTRIACDIARFRLYDDNTPEEVEDRYKANIDFLKSVAAGKVTIGPADDGTVIETDDTVQLQSAGHVFKRSDHGFM